MEDQFEEYRRAMQQRYHGAAGGGPRREDDERKRREQQLREDEELAKKLQESYYGAPGRNQSSPQYNPPNYVPNQRSDFPQNNNLPPSHYQIPNYPPPRQYPPPESNQNRYPNRQNNYDDRPLNSASESFLPQINDKCLGFNTQYCVLATAGILTIGIVTSLVFLFI